MAIILVSTNACTSRMMLFMFTVLLLFLQRTYSFQTRTLHYSKSLFTNSKQLYNVNHASNAPLSVTDTTIVEVDLGDRSYPIYIGQSLLDEPKLFSDHITSKKALIVTNTKVGPLYSAIVRENLENSGIEVFEVILPDGEQYKTMDILMQIIDAAMAAKLDRKSTMIALGGGVIGDMCGFAAAIYQRGIKFVQVPTTLMAMVDSAVGGKTAVNHPLGKNMIGAFYQPEAVIIDTNTLNTLPDRELKSGISEIIKYGLIRDENFFCWLEKNAELLLSRDPAALVQAIQRSCENKAEVVAADEKEGGVRATLNLGHTFGHAIENGLGYGAWLHGEAVAAGIAMAAELSKETKAIESSLFDRTVNLLQKCDLPITLENRAAMEALGHETYNEMRSTLSTNKFLELMSMDKKVADGQLSLILLKGELGRCEITNKFDPVMLTKVVDSYCSLLPSLSSSATTDPTTTTTTAITTTTASSSNNTAK